MKNKAKNSSADAQKPSAPSSKAGGTPPAAARAPARSSLAYPAAPAPATPSAERRSLIGRLAARVTDRLRGDAAPSESSEAALAEARARIETLTSENASHKKAAKQAQATAKRFRALAVAFCGPLAIKPEELAKKTPAEISELVSSRIGTAAAEKIAELGQPLAEVPETTSTESTSDRAELLAEFNAITDPGKRAAFYAKHKDRLGG